MPAVAFGTRARLIPVGELLRRLGRARVPVVGRARVPIADRGGRGLQFLLVEAHQGEEFHPRAEGGPVGTIVMTPGRTREKITAAGERFIAQSTLECILPLDRRPRPWWS